MEINEGSVEVMSTYNGYILKHTWYEDTAENGAKIFDSETEVFEKSDEDDDKRDEALVNLLYKISELLGHFNNKYDKFKLKICFEENKELEE